jgi:hypothetical protein
MPHPMSLRSSALVTFSAIVFLPRAAAAQSSDLRTSAPVLNTTLTEPVPQAEPTPMVISSDRPSFSDGTGIVPLGHLQVESGYTFTFHVRRDVETQRHNCPEILARVAIAEDRFELRFLTSGYVWTRSSSGSGYDSDEGWNDIALGFKLKMTDQSGWLPRLALGAQSTLGIGTDGISNQMAEPTLKLIWSYDLGQSFGDKWKGFTLGGNANIAWPTTNGDRFTQGQGSIYLSFPVVDRMSGFVEYYVLGPNAKGTDAAHYTDLGAVYLLTDTIQLDARVGFGLNDEADNLFTGLGISFLFLPGLEVASMGNDITAASSKPQAARPTAAADPRASARAAASTRPTSRSASGCMIVHA